MATNLEKLKSEIAEMGAEEFRRRAYSYIDHNTLFNAMCEQRRNNNECFDEPDCYTCIEKWLNEESEETNET